MNRMALVAVPLALGISGVLWWSVSREKRLVEAKSSRSKSQLNAAEGLEERVLALEADNRRMRGELALTRVQTDNLNAQVEPSKEHGVQEQERVAERPAQQSGDERRDQIGRALIRRHPKSSGGFETTYYFSRPGEPLEQLDQALVGEYN